MQLRKHIFIIFASTFSSGWWVTGSSLANTCGILQVKKGEGYSISVFLEFMGKKAPKMGMVKYGRTCFTLHDENIWASWGSFSSFRNYIWKIKRKVVFVFAVLMTGKLNLIWVLCFVKIFYLWMCETGLQRCYGRVFRNWVRSTQSEMRIFLIVDFSFLPVLALFQRELSVM